MTYNRRWPKTLTISLVSMFAALNIIADLVPLTPILGLQGTFFRLGWVLAPLTGILLGPVTGGLSCVIASLVELFLGVQGWAPFGIFSPFRAGLSAFQAGLVVKGRWKTALSIMGTLIVLWALNPLGRDALIVLVFHIVGSLLIISIRSKIRDYIDSPVLWKLTLSITVASYYGNVSRHLLGNVLLIYLVGTPSLIFLSAFPFTLIEQVSFTAAATILGVALYRTRLRRFLDFSHFKEMF